MALPSCFFEDRFNVRSVDHSKFEKVGRIKARSLGFAAEIQLDINTDIFPVTERQSIVIGIADRVTADGQEAGTQQLLDHTSTSLMDKYDHVLYGKIFQLEDKGADKRVVYASFGGLLMALTADKQVLGELQMDMRIYLLIRRFEDNV